MHSRDGYFDVFSKDHQTIVTPDTIKVTFNTSNSLGIDFIGGDIHGRLRPANERRRYKITLFLIGWVQA